MKIKYLLFIIIGWILLKLFEYYYLDWILWFPLWIIIIIILLILIVKYLIEMIKIKNNIKYRIIKLFIIVGLFILSIFPMKTHYFISRIDWAILYPIRNNIVEKIINDEIVLTKEFNYYYKYPYILPIISHRGNEVVVIKNNNKIIIIFYIFKELFDESSEYFVYTNDLMVVNDFEKLLKEKHEYNWKIKDNWYKLGYINLEEYCKE
jgi:hypothetical protein